MFVIERSSSGDSALRPSTCRLGRAQSQSVAYPQLGEFRMRVGKLRRSTPYLLVSEDR